MNIKNTENLLKELSRIANALERIAAATEVQKAPKQLGKKILPELV